MRDLERMKTKKKRRLVFNLGRKAVGEDELEDLNWLAGRGLEVLDSSASSQTAEGLNRTGVFGTENEKRS